jgi:hypothetical protein
MDRYRWGFSGVDNGTVGGFGGLDNGTVEQFRGVDNGTVGRFGGLDNGTDCGLVSVAVFRLRAPLADEREMGAPGAGCNQEVAFGGY